MSSYRLTFLLMALVCAAVSYFASENLYITIIVGSVLLLYPQIFLVKKLEKSQQSFSRYHECFHFVNTFIVSLDIRGSLSGAFSSINTTMNKSYLAVYEGIASNKSEDKINYLQKYYPFHFYGLFIKVVSLWQEQGGDILTMSSHLLEEGRKSEEHLRYCHDLYITKTVEFIVLWIFAFLILIVMRISLNQLFQYIINKIVYQIGLGLFFLFFLVSVDVLVRKITKKEIKGWDEYE